MNHSLKINSLTIACKEFHLTNCKLESATELVHQYFLSVEVDTDADIPTTCWLSTWWDCKCIYTWITCSWWIPDIKVIWYIIKSQFGKASATVTVVVQCDGSQGDTCGEYEQQFAITPSNPFIIFAAAVLSFSKVRVYQFLLGTITVDIVSYNDTIWMTTWIVPTVGIVTLRSGDCIILKGIFGWVHLTRNSVCYIIQRGLG